MYTKEHIKQINKTKLPNKPTQITSQQNYLNQLSYLPQKTYINKYLQQIRQNLPQQPIHQKKMSGNFPFSPSTNPYSTSSYDHQQQLRTFVNVLQQYQHMFQQLTTRHGDTIKNTHSFQQFINKVKLRAQYQVQALYEGMKNMRKILQDVFEKSLNILPQIIKQLIQSKQKSQYLSEQLSEKQLIIQSLKYRKQQVQRHLHEIAALYEKTRHDNVQLNERMSRKQQQFENQSQEIRKTFLEVTQTNQMQKKILQELYDTNQKLSNTLMDTKKQKKQMEQQIFKIALQLTKSRNKINLLEEEIQQRDFKIKQFQLELENVHRTHRKRSIASNDPDINGRQFQEIDNFRQSFSSQLQGFKVQGQNKIKLTQELSNYKVPTIKELNGSFIRGSVIKRSIGQQSDYISQYQQPPIRKPSTIIVNNQRQISQQPIPAPKNPNIQIQPQPRLPQSRLPQPTQSPDLSYLKQKQIFDPYFSHYILISQSVKIKQDCQDMLNIDMKPYYNEVIEKRIPMHLWDQWIKNRLRELLRQNIQYA